LDARRQYVVFFVVVAAVVAAGFALARSRGQRAGAREVLDAVPGDSWLVVTVDVAALRASPLAKPLLGGGTSELAGLGPLPDACGFDPVPRLRTLAVASPEGGERGDFGVVFDGDLTRSELATCAEKIIGARGGRASSSTREGFAVVEDGGDAKRTRLAYRDGGPFLVGRGAWLDAMIDAFARKHERVSANAQHAALRAALAGSAAKGTTSPTVVLTALLPKALRERLKAEMGAEVGSEGDRAYAAVLAVEAAGIALTTGQPGAAGAPGPSADLTAELRCETAEACAEVEKLIERKRLDVSKGFAARLLGLSPLLDTLAVQTHGAALEITAHAPAAEVADAIQRLVDLRRPAPTSASATGDAGPR
jgi:hypothetical protein